jgi:hypothetical protein
MIRKLVGLTVTTALVLAVLWITIYRLDCGCWPWQKAPRCSCFSGA